MQTGAMGALPQNSQSAGTLLSGNYNLGTYTLPTFDLNTISLTGLEKLEMRAIVNFSLVKAHGGTIVICKRENGLEPEYYIIPEGVKNFDRELGKIISMFMLKG